jgi:AhpD family alkylhydroperoxidase
VPVHDLSTSRYRRVGRCLPAGGGRGYQIYGGHADRPPARRAAAPAGSQLNNCTYCLNLHYQAAREAGIPRAKIDTLTAWSETELHSEAEQAALRYTEALTRAADTDRDAAFQRFHEALAENFNPEEILEIVGVVVNMNVWTRIKLAEGAMPGPRHTDILGGHATSLR